MSDTLRRRAKRLFEQVLERSTAEREEFIREACGADTLLEAELRSLLEAHDAADAFLQPEQLVAAVEELGHEQSDPLTGAQIGSYHVIDLLGRGGMGAVYRARQDNPRREVALKLVDRMIVTRTLLRRFEVEAQMLARLRHPGIAHIYEAGTHETELGERPYFAMELIDGSPITSYADARALGRRARLELLIKVCEAVEHAHRFGIIHRDLKPGNILVTADGQPKILDFGVARSADTDLQVTTMAGSPGDLVGTLPYMSPEQVRGDPDALDTRSDVYALGVLCFELLTGSLPRDLSGKGLTDAIRIITEENPRRLNAAGKGRFPGDLETIVGTALAGEKARRYSSVSELAADLRRFLDGQPVTARPQGALYQLRKLVSRHRLPAALVAGLIVLSVASAIVMSVQSRHASRQRDRANLEAETAKEVSTFLESLFTSVHPGQTLGKTVTARELLDRGAERIETELEGQPVVRARLLVLMGRVYDALGLPERAEPLLERAVELGRAVGRDDLSRSGQAYLQDGLIFLARRRAAQQRNEEAIELTREAVRFTEALFGWESLEHATALNSLAYQLALVGESDESGELIERGLALRERLLGPRNEHVAWSRFQYAWHLKSIAELSASAEQFDLACDIWEEVLPANHPQIASCLFGHASVLLDMDQVEDAFRLYQRILAIRRQSLGADHPDVAEALNNLGYVYWRLGKPEQAYDACAEALETYRRRFGDDHPRVLRILLSLGGLAEELGDPEKAEAHLKERLALALRHHGEGSEPAREARASLDDFVAGEAAKARGEDP